MNAFESLLRLANYNSLETDFLIDSFKNGFDIGYRGPIEGVRRFSPNLKLRVGSQTILWNKMMKEVKLKRFAGPFSEPPFTHFIQSPVGLVPKDGGNDTRLIFHLSYPRNGSSINSETPAEFCSVKYPDFSEAVRLCLKTGGACRMGKSDFTSAFRNLGLKRKCFPLLVMMVTSPIDGKDYYFVDKCLPFGASISCSHFQRFSNAVAFLVQYRTKKPVINYLDDYFFAALTALLCNRQIDVFLDICKTINFPVSLEKTFWSTTTIIFLGFLIDSINQTISIPLDKVEKAKTIINSILSSRKITVLKLQRACRILNFLCRCIVPGRAFTRRLYTYYSTSMKPHHHIRVSTEMKEDLKIWIQFLNNPEIYCRPFIDFGKILKADNLSWFTDASGKIGFGGIWENEWFKGLWPKSFLERCNPSIEFQELYAVVTSVILWGENFKNRRICLYCNNQAVVQMINYSTSSCKNCMKLIRILTLICLDWNLRVFTQFIPTKSNYLADALSRGQMHRFWFLATRDNINVVPSGAVLPLNIADFENNWIFH